MKSNDTASNWIKIDEQPLVKGTADSAQALTESKDIPGEIRMFRGTTSLSYGITEIATAISEPEARVKWVERLAQNKLIKGKPSEGEWWSYEAYELVWPVSDRDYVFRQTLTKSVNEGQNRTVVQVQSIEHPDYPITSEKVRGSLPTCIFTLDEVSKKETRFEVMVQVDPGGNLPEFIKNLIQKGWAYKTMQALNTYMINHSN